MRFTTKAIVELFIFPASQWDQTKLGSRRWWLGDLTLQKEWQERWFNLEGDTLYWSEKEGDAKGSRGTAQVLAVKRVPAVGAALQVQETMEVVSALVRLTSAGTSLGVPRLASALKTVLVNP